MKRRWQGRRRRKLEWIDDKEMLYYCFFLVFYHLMCLVSYSICCRMFVRKSNRTTIVKTHTHTRTYEWNNNNNR